jgi:hypothetical protein
VRLVVFQNVLEALGDLSEHVGVDLTFLILVEIAVFRGDIQDLVLPVHLSRLVALSVGLDAFLGSSGALVVRLEDDLVVGYLLVQPLEGNDQLLGEPDIVPLQFLDVLLVLRQLPADLDGEVGDLHADGLHLTQKDLDDLLVVGELLPVVLVGAGKRNRLENVLLGEGVRVQELIQYDLAQMVVLL